MATPITRNALFIVFFLVAACATDPGSTTSTTGSAIFRYEDGDFDILVNREGQTVYAAAVLFTTDSNGLRVQATEIEEGTSVVWPTTVSFTLTEADRSTKRNCSEDPTLQNTADYPAARIFTFILPEGCSPTTISASASLSVNRTGQPTRTINGSASSSSGGTGSSGLSHHTVFVTSQTYNGNLGGLSGADAICASRAQAGAYTSSLSGTWMAILSDEADSAAGRLNLSTLEVRNVLDSLIDSSGTGMWDASLSAPIDVDENGTTVSTALNVWTGSTSAGAISHTHCLSWTSVATGIGREGLLNKTNSTWIANVNSPCSAVKRLYCINR